MQMMPFYGTIRASMQNGTNLPATLSKDHVDEAGPQQATGDEDARLVASCRSGDTDAFEGIVSKYEKKMFNIAFRITGNYEDACETVQDAFVAAYRNIRTFRGKSKFSTWLTAITINHAKNRLKQTKGRRSREAYSIDDPVPTPDGEVQADPPSNEPSALEHLEKQALQQRVQDCISALEPGFQEVLVLRDIQGHSYDEIGAALSMREGTVKSRLSRARDAIKECLKRVMGSL